MTDHTETKIRAGILGASGYTGGDLVRLLVRHPYVDIVFMTADRHAGKQMDTVFPHLFGLELPPLVSVDEIARQSGLPAGTVSAMLMELELTGEVARLPGGLVQRVASAR